MIRQAAVFRRELSCDHPVGELSRPEIRRAKRVRAPRGVGARVPRAQGAGKFTTAGCWLRAASHFPPRAAGTAASTPIQLLKTQGWCLNMSQRAFVSVCLWKVHRALPMGRAPTGSRPVDRGRRGAADSRFFPLRAEREVFLGQNTAGMGQAQAQLQQVEPARLVPSGADRRMTRAVRCLGLFG